MSNQTRLFVLVFLCFLPSIALYVHADRSHEASELDDHLAELLRLANQAGQEYRLILDDTRTLLGALSEMSEFQRAERSDCDSVLSRVMGHTLHYTAIQLIEPDGFVTCGSLAIDQELIVSDRYYHQAAMANRQFSVGEFVVGRLSGKPIVGMALPVIDREGQDISGVLAAYLDLDRLANGIYEMDVPHDVTVTVIDRAGRIMIRVPAGVSALGPDTVGAEVPATFPVPTGQVLGPYLLEGIDLDGVGRYFAVEPLSAGGRPAPGHLLVGRSRTAMLSDVDAAGTRRLQLLAVAAGFMFVLAWMFGHYTLLRDPNED